MKSLKCKFLNQTLTHQKLRGNTSINHMMISLRFKSKISKLSESTRKIVNGILIVSLIIPKIPTILKKPYGSAENWKRAPQRDQKLLEVIDNPVKFFHKCQSKVNHLKNPSS